MKTNISTRMKQYEQTFKHHLIKKLPVIIRLDGKTFHSFTKQIKAQKPYDNNLKEAFNQTIKSIFNEIHNLKFVYQQSDEVSLLLTDYEKIETEPYLNNNIQKITSITSSIFTTYFNKYINQSVNAYFDCRCFNLPKEEVVNYFIWRQQDATRNSISSFAQSLFSHKRLQGLNQKELQFIMLMEKGFNWNETETWKKRGISTYKIDRNIITDENIPIFTQNREYIQQFI